MRPQLLSKCYGSIVVTVKWYDIRCHNSSSAIIFLNQKPSFVASKAATYLASVVESTIMGCLELFQLTTPPLHTNTYPNIDILLSGSNMKSESVYLSTHNSEPPPKTKNKFFVLFKYLKMFFTAI